MTAPDIPAHADAFPTEDALLEHYTGADTATLERFWADIRARGTPLRDPAGHRVTFLWRHPHGTITPDTDPVHLHINRVTDKDNYAAGIMTGIPGTDIWVRTLEVAPTLRASYSFALHAAGSGRPQGPPPYNRYPAYRDLLSHGPHLVTDGEAGNGLSLLAGPFSPPQPEWDPTDTPAGPRGEIITANLTLTVRDGTAPSRRCWLYLPPTTTDAYADGAVGRRIPLLTLFDAETWFGRLPLPRALERAVDLGRIPPVAVLGIENLGLEDRYACLGANPCFLRSVATDAAAWAEEEATARGTTLADRSGRFIAGQSLGGLSALLAAHVLPGSYAAAICQSSSLWWTPDGKSTPRDFGGRSTDWITEESAVRPPQDTRVLLDVGAREALTLPRTHLLDQTLRSRGWDSNVAVYDGGHDFAWWRGALFDRLEEILRPS